MMPLLDSCRILASEGAVPENGLPLEHVPGHPPAFPAAQPASVQGHPRPLWGWTHCIQGAAEAGIVVTHFLGEAAAALGAKLHSEALTERTGAQAS